MTESDLNARSQRVLDQLLWSIDRRNWAEAESLLSDNVTLDYTELFEEGGIVETTGSGFCEHMRAMLGPLDATQHSILGSVQAKAADDDSINVTANVVGIHNLKSHPDPVWTVGGWYEAVIRTDGGQDRVSTLTLHPSWESGSREILPTLGILG